MHHGDSFYPSLPFLVPLAMCETANDLQEIQVMQNINMQCKSVSQIMYNQVLFWVERYLTGRAYEEV